MRDAICDYLPLITNKLVCHSDEHLLGDLCIRPRESSNDRRCKSTKSHDEPPGMSVALSD